MYNNQQEEDQLVPKWKVALIPILGIALIVILIPKADAKQSTGSQTTQLALSLDGDKPEAEEEQVAPLPEGTLDVAAEFNPFQMGNPLKMLTFGAPEEPKPDLELMAKQKIEELAREERKRQVAAQLASLKQLNVSMIIQTGNKTAAIVNSKRVYVGDEVQPGIIVTHIDSGGIKLGVKPETQSEMTTSLPVPQPNRP